MKCANVNHPDYKRLREVVGDSMAHYYWDKYDGYIDFNSPEISDLFKKVIDSSKSIAELYPELNVVRESWWDFNNKINQLKTVFESKGFKVTVLEDNSMPDSANVQRIGNDVIITVNPSKQRTSDTVPHEFGHVLINMLGRSHRLVNKAIGELKSQYPELWNRVQTSYTEISFERQELELLVTVMGAVAAKRMADGTGPMSTVRYYVNALIDLIADKLGFKTDATRQLFEKMYSGSFSKQDQKVTGTDRSVGTLDPIEAKAQSENINLNEDNTEDTFYESNGKRYNRLTEFVTNTFGKKFKGKKNSYFEAMAERVFNEQDKDLSATVLYEEKEMTFGELTAAIRMNVNTHGRIRGKIGHYLLEYAIRPSKEVLKKVQELAAGKEGEYHATDLSSLVWLERNAQEIFKKIGINVDKDTLPAERDEIIPELTITSDLLELGTTIDQLVKHTRDNLYSIIDFKLGAKFLKDATTEKILEYGNQNSLINDSSLSKAKLEVMLRAFTIKEKYNPNAVFKFLRVSHITNNDRLVTNHDVEVASYLAAIEGYMKANKPTEYAIAKERGLFGATNYLAEAQDFDVDNAYKELPADQAITLMEQKIQMVNNKIKELPADETEKWEKELRALTEAIIKRRAESGVQVDLASSMPSDADMGIFKRYLGNFYSVANTTVTTLGKILVQNNKDIADELDYFRATKNVLMRAVLDEHNEKNNSSISKLTRGNLTNFNYKNLFDFMWEEKTIGGVSGMYARRITPEQIGDGTNGTFTKAQYEYNKWYHDIARAKYDEVMSKPAYTDKQGRVVTKAQAMGYPAELPDNWMPRIPMSLEEVRERAEGVGEQIKLHAVHVFHKNISTFMREMYDNGNKKSGIPLKYLGLGQRGENIIAAKNYSLNADAALDMFMTNLIAKDIKDTTLAVAEGIVNNYRFRKNPDTNKPYLENTIGFLEDRILLDILGDKREMSFTRKPITIKIGGVDYKIKIDDIMLGLKSWVTWAGMYFKPVAATWNAGLIILMNSKDAIKGSLALTAGINPDDIDYSLTDLGFGQKEYGAMQLANMQGKKHKLQVLARKFRYLADNYDYRSPADELLATKNPLIDSSFFYVFHRIGEEYGQYTVMAALLKHMKTVDKDGNTISMYDAYDDEGNYIGGERGKLKDNTVVTGLTANELQRMKRVYARMHGGYRQEERTALELYALGQWVLQFKKFLPSILENVLQGKYNDVSLGKYTRRKNETGQEYLEWVGRNNEGRLWVLLKFLGNIAMLNRGNAEYTWNNLRKNEPEKFQHLLDVMVAGGFFTIMYGVGQVMFKDSDEDDPWKMRYMRLTEDMTQGYNPYDLLRSMQTQTTVLPKVFQTMGAFGDYLISGGEKGGKIIARNTPFSSSVYEYNRFLDAGEGRMR